MSRFNSFVNRHPYITLVLGIATMAIVITCSVCAVPAPTNSTTTVTFDERSMQGATEDRDETLTEMTKVMEAKSLASFATAMGNTNLTAEEVAKANLYGEVAGKVYLELLQDPCLDDRAASTLGAIVGAYTLLDDDDPVLKFSAIKSFEILLLYNLGEEASQKMAAATAKVLEETADVDAAKEAAIWRVVTPRAPIDLECLVADRVMYYILKSL